MDNKLKTGLISLVALVGGYSLFTKNFNKGFEADTFMASSERAIRAKNLNFVWEWANTDLSDIQELRRWHNDNYNKWMNVDSARLGEKLALEWGHLSNNGLHYESPLQYSALRTSFLQCYRDYLNENHSGLFDGEKYRELIGNVADAVASVKEDSRYELIWGYKQQDAIASIGADESVINGLDELNDFVDTQRAILGGEIPLQFVGSNRRSKYSSLNFNSLHDMFGRDYYHLNIPFNREVVIGQMQANNEWSGSKNDIAVGLIPAYGNLEFGNLPYMESFSEWLLTKHITPNSPHQLHYLNIYRSVLIYDTFFKANPAIATVGTLYKNRWEMMEKYYEGEFNKISAKGVTMEPIYNWEALEKYFTVAKYNSAIEKIVTRYKELATLLIKKGNVVSPRKVKLEEEVDTHNKISSLNMINEWLSSKDVTEDQKTLFIRHIISNNRYPHRFGFENGGILPHELKVLNTLITPSGRTQYSIDTYDSNGYLSMNDFGLTVKDLKIPTSIKDIVMAQEQTRFDNYTESIKGQIENLERNLSRQHSQLEEFIKILD